jgi:hypothetical protein
MNSFQVSKNNKSNLNTSSIIHCSPSKLSSSNVSFCSNKERNHRDLYNHRNRNSTILFTPRSSALDYLEINKSTEADDVVQRKTRFDGNNTKFDPLQNLVFLGKKRRFNNLNPVNEISINSIGRIKKPFGKLEIRRDMSMIIPSQEKNTKDKSKKNKVKKPVIDKKEKNPKKVEKKTTKKKEPKKKSSKSNKDEKSNVKNKNKSKKKQKDVIKSIMANILNFDSQVRTRSQYRKQKLII